VGVFAGPTDDWWNLTGGTDILRTNIATEQVIQDGLVLNLDAGVSSSYPGSGTSWNNLSGTGNSGTLYGSVGYDSANGGSLVFGGRPENTDYFGITDIFNVEGVTNYSASLWIKIDSAESGIDSRFFWHGSYGVLIYKGGDNKLYFNLTTSSVPGGAKTDTQVNILFSSYFDVWVNIAISYDGTIMKLYVNGDLKGSRTIIGVISPLVQPSTLWLGALPLGFINFWTACNMSQVSIYNRALTAQEIQQNFNATRGRFGV